MAKKLYKTFFILLCIFVLSACELGKDPAVGVVENYITALVNKDINRMSALSCSTWEQGAHMEFDSFQAIKTRLDGLACTVTSTDKDKSSVTCKGKIIATYDNEDEDFDLSTLPYQVVNQGGEFLVCGHQ